MTYTSLPSFCSVTFRSVGLLSLVILGLRPSAAQVTVPYTSGIGLYSVPPGVNQVSVQCWGGGGRGSTATLTGAFGGGGGGAYAARTVSVAPGSLHLLIVGAGSTGTGPGGDSWFSNLSTVLAKGGSSAGNNNSAGANGGDASTSVGTVRHSGGKGAAGSASGAGGGGSAAGASAAGTLAVGSTGAVAPAGGGNGGNGRSGGQGDGQAGLAPGGGGGGAWRNNGVARNGGAGGNGLVLVSAPYNEGSCYTSNAEYNIIRDNGCGVGTTTRVGITRSGLPSTMGTAPGQARLMSVELIVAHTTNNDLEVRLTAPNGQVRDLVLDRFGNGDNLGNPGTCAPLVLRDGATALSNGTVNNATGPYAPEQALAGFTGNPNGTWTVSFCDDAAGAIGYVRMVRLNFCVTPDISATTNGSPVCVGTTVPLGVTATGTAPLTYVWSGTGTFLPSSISPSVTVSGAVTGSYSVTVSNACGSRTMALPVTVSSVPSATISYGPMPVCRAQGPLAVIRTGTAGGSYSAPAGLSINPTTGTIDPGASTAGTYTVSYTISGTGCTPFVAQATVVVRAAFTWYADADGDGFGDPSAAQLACNAIPGHVLNASDNCPQIFGRIGDACDDGDADTVNDEIRSSCACSGTIAPWYSRGSGSHTAAIWSQDPGGIGVAVSFDAGSQLIVQSGHTVELASDLEVADLTVQNGGMLNALVHTLRLRGEELIVNGTLDGSKALVRIEAGAPFAVSGAGTLDVRDLEIDAPAGVTQGVNMRVYGTLSLLDGAFTATANTRLVSNAAGTARLGPVGSGASYIGDLIVERYIPGGATNWRLIGSPVAGTTVLNWKDDFFTAGFPGSHYPNFYSGGQLWPSVRRYDETVGSVDINAGLIGVAGTSEALLTGRGYAAWSGDVLGGTAPFTLDVKGNPTIAHSPVSLPMSWTDSGNPAADGWNLVSVPLPSPIDFEAVQLGADVTNGYWLFDPATGNTLSWSNGVGVGAANGILQSSQGFWLKANGPAVTTTVDESAKAQAGIGGAFGGDQEQQLPILRLSLTSSVNSFSDQVAVVFAEGTPAFDAIDAQQFVFAHPSAPQIAVRSSDGVNLSIDFFGGHAEAISIPVMLNAAVTGTYTITAEMTGDHPLSCISIEDVATGTIVPFGDGASYSLTLQANDDPSMPRLMLHATAPLALDLQPATCHGANTGAATIDVGSDPVDITWNGPDGSVQTLTGVSGPVTLDALAAGSYTFTVATGAACGQLQGSFSIEQPFALEASVQAMTNTSCPNSVDGTVEVTVLGGVAPYGYQWSNGSTDAALVAGAGLYDLAVTDANGCALSITDLLIGAGDGPEAAIVAATEAFVNEPMIFTTPAEGVTSWSWSFGDGTGSTEVSPVHTYTVPGLYTVQLTVSNGTCSSTSTHEVAVESTTAVVEATVEELRAWAREGDIVVDHPRAPGSIRVEVFDAGGRLVIDQRSSGAAGRTVIRSVEGTGIFTLRITLQDQRYTARVLVAR